MRLIFRLLLLAALTACLPARADELMVEGVDQAQATAAERPGRGISMQAVAAKWGEPASRTEAIGQPPITRWQYPQFVVFFEHSHVIHAVVPR